MKSGGGFEPPGLAAARSPRGENSPPGCFLTPLGRSLRSLPPGYSPFGLITLRPGESKPREKNKSTLLRASVFLAGGGFEPPDLRVMSPTSYQTALSRGIMRRGECRKPGLNRYVTHVTRDFKSRASANSAIPARPVSTGFLFGTRNILPHNPRFVNTKFDYFHFAQKTARKTRFFLPRRMCFSIDNYAFS